MKVVMPKIKTKVEAENLSYWKRLARGKMKDRHTHGRASWRPWSGDVSMTSITMKQAAVLFLFFLIILPSLPGAHDFFCFENPRSAHQEPIDHSQRDPRVPECPHGISLEDCIDPFIHDNIETDPSNAVTSFFSIAPDLLFDQGVVRSIFRPPASIL